MKKWLIIALTCILLLLYCAFVLVYRDCMYPPQQETAQAMQPAATEDAQATAATLPTTEPTLPLETVMPADYQLTGKHAFVYDCDSKHFCFPWATSRRRSLLPA